MFDGSMLWRRRYVKLEARFSSMTADEKPHAGKPRMVVQAERNPTLVR